MCVHAMGKQYLKLLFNDLKFFHHYTNFVWYECMYVYMYVCIYFVLLQIEYAFMCMPSKHYQ